MDDAIIFLVSKSQNISPKLGEKSASDLSVKSLSVNTASKDTDQVSESAPASQGFKCYLKGFI